MAIKEGGYKSLQITEEHFKGLYGGVPLDYFIYDSAKLGQVRNFATSSNIQVMVVTVGAINKFGDEQDAEAVALLRVAVHERSAAEQHVIDAIRTARASGMSWSAIGAFVGTSGEAARQRYADKVA